MFSVLNCLTWRLERVPLFRDDMRAQQEKRIQTLVSMVEQITHPEMFIRIVTGLARRHVDNCARPEHYAAVGEALLAALAKVLGPRFTPDVKEHGRRCTTI